MSIIKTPLEVLIESLEEKIAANQFIELSQENLKMLVEGYLKIKKMAGTDELSGLINSNRAFDNFIKFYLSLYRQYQFQERDIQCTFITFDADNFSRGNSIYGHYFMDNVIKVIGKIISLNIRQTDIGIRLGGEEFGVVCEIGTEENAIKKANTIIKSIAEYKFNRDFQQTVSAGVYLFSFNNKNYLDLDQVFTKYEQLFQSSSDDRNKINEQKQEQINELVLPIFIKSRECSDDALYKAKMDGKNKIELYNVGHDYSNYRNEYSKRKI